MTYDDMYIALVQEFPELQVVSKDKSRFMRFLNSLLLLLSFGQQQHFLVSFTTTIGNRIYVPVEWSSYDDRTKVSILRHERVHLRQQRQHGLLWFGVLYLLAFFPVGFAYYRMKFEQEAYAESMLAHAEYYGWRSLSNAEYRRRITGHFTTGQYLWMWPWKKSVNTWYYNTSERIGRTLINRKKLGSLTDD